MVEKNKIPLQIEFHRPTPKTFFTIPQTIRTKLINQIKKECGEAFKNEDLVRAIQVTHEQREAMLDAWYAYTARYAQYIRSQLATLRLIDVPASSSSSSSSWTRHCLQDQAIDHLGACDKVSHLERIVSEEYQARFDLVLQTVKILSPLQSLYIRLSTLYSCDIRVSYGIILGLDFDKCEALMEVGHPTISECQALSCALRSLSSVSTISSLSKEKDEKRIT